MKNETQSESANLTYYIFEGLLVGFAGERFFHVAAGSGGGAGSTKNSPSFHANNPYSTGVKTQGTAAKHVHGGPIPVGKYRISTPAQHPHLGRSAYLQPSKPAALHGRSGFFIHGRGSHGSDGCIVPYSQFQELMDALQGSQGGNLFVLETMGDIRFA